MRVVCTQQLVWTLLSLLRESYLSIHMTLYRSVLPLTTSYIVNLNFDKNLTAFILCEGQLLLRVLINEHIFLFLWPIQTLL